jgi:hypothetical protein
MAAVTTSTIMIAAPRATVMTVIADFAAYPGWAGVRSAEVVGEPDADGRARMVRFGLDAGIIKDRFVLGYQWDGDEQVRWELAEHGSVISAMSGAYILAGRGDGTGSANVRTRHAGFWQARRRTVSAIRTGRPAAGRSCRSRR